MPEGSSRIETPRIFVAEAAVCGPFHQQVASALQDAGADAWLYEWATPQARLRNRVAQALWRRPITLLTVATPHADHRANTGRRRQALKMELFI